MAGQITPEMAAAAEWMRLTTGVIENTIDAANTHNALEHLRFDTEVLDAELSLEEPVGEDVDMADDAEVGETMEEAAYTVDAAQVAIAGQVLEVAAAETQQMIAIMQSGELDDDPEAAQRVMDAVIGQMAAVEEAVNTILIAIQESEERVDELQPLVDAAVASKITGGIVDDIDTVYGDAVDRLDVLNEEGDDMLAQAEEIMDVLYDVLEELA